VKIEEITVRCTCCCTSYIGMMLYWWTECEEWENNSTLYMLLYVIYWYDVIVMDWMWILRKYQHAVHVAVRHILLWCYTDGLSGKNEEITARCTFAARHILVCCYTEGLTGKTEGNTARCTCCCTTPVVMILYWWTDCKVWGNYSKLYILVCDIYRYDFILKDRMWSLRE
jgi:hypothetical protein